jgi:hypothetical protein
MPGTGIYVQDILDAVPIDKFFELFKPGVGGEGGYIRVGMTFATQLDEVDAETGAAGSVCLYLVCTGGTGRPSRASPPWVSRSDLRDSLTPFVCLCLLQVSRMLRRGPSSPNFRSGATRMTMQVCVCARIRVRRCCVDSGQENVLLQSCTMECLFEQRVGGV